jgi:hypothetical protein
MSPSPQLTLIPRSLEPQESLVRSLAGLDRDTRWPDAALLSRAVYASILPFLWT